MKLAISSEGKTLESEIDARFGRCSYFLIVDIDKGKKQIKNTKAIENTAKAQMGGAGITAGEIVANEKVNAIITTNLGPRAFQVFSQFRIKIYKAEGKIKQAVEDFIDGKLKEMTDATGPQHRGMGK